MRKLGSGSVDVWSLGAQVVEFWPWQKMAHRDPKASGVPRTYDRGYSRAEVSCIHVSGLKEFLFGQMVAGVASPGAHVQLHRNRVLLHLDVSTEARLAMSAWGWE